MSVPREALRKVSPYLYEISAGAVPGLRVPAQFFVSERLLGEISSDRSIDQLVNVGMLPGVVERVIAMPDMHEGYGFPIGGVAATELPSGIISPGGVGYDINCGVRLMLSDATMDEVKPRMEELASELMRAVPSGTGRGGRIRLGAKELDDVLARGSAWCLERGMATAEDITHTESRGTYDGADPAVVSERAKSRGRDQLGTLGSGNHFLEVQRVETVFDEDAARVYGLRVGQACVAVHCGSRGLGHQVCTDFVRLMLANLKHYGFALPDPELACAPANTIEGRRYLAAMAAAANFAWANRQTITHHVRIEWNRLFPGRPLRLLYDVSHNVAKIETHKVRGEDKKLIVHRKGATRAFPPGHSEVPEDFRAVGQPVFIPGTMGTASYVLAGTEEAMRRTFGTVCHGAGRRMSRHAAKRAVSGSELRRRLEERGIVVRCHSDSGLAEESPEAYKDIEEVIAVTAGAGLAKPVARLVPVAVVKGE